MTPSQESRIVRRKDDAESTEEDSETEDHVDAELRAKFLKIKENSKIVNVVLNKDYIKK